mmetsp:Transcript_46907/g.81961  ORF Transcript_46907/g.81961 Transcript_46907/m.81961 type:complete len:231 (-) Transcript_46907:42-734(-)
MPHFFSGFATAAAFAFAAALDKLDVTLDAAFEAASSSDFVFSECRESSYFGRSAVEGFCFKQPVKCLWMKLFSSSCLGVLVRSRAKQKSTVSAAEEKTSMKGRDTKKQSTADTTARKTGSSTYVSWVGSLYCDKFVATMYVDIDPAAVMPPTPAISKRKVAPCSVMAAVALCVRTDIACPAAVQKLLELIAMSMYANLFSFSRNRSKQETKQVQTEAMTQPTELPVSFIA